MSPATAGVHALYVHIPFCERRCEYCDFASVAGLRGEREYVDALRAELRGAVAALGRLRLRSVFVGGGTPGLIPPQHLHEVLDEVRALFALDADAEVTIEANPSSTSAARAQAWLEAGVTRVSIGVQSLDPDALRFLGRVHDADRALAALDEVRAAGFERRSADLIYAVPGLSDASWRRTLEQVLERECGHLSCYELTVEPGTPLHRSVEAGVTRSVDSEVALRQHWTAVDLAATAGYRQYEVSNLAWLGHECRHSLAYWAGEFYLAVGVGAHGHLPVDAARALGVVDPEQPLAADAVAVRYWHARSPLRYRRDVAAARPVAGSEVIRPPDALAERVLVGLRRHDGVGIEAPAARGEAQRLAATGLLDWDGEVARVTRRGQDVLDAIALRLVDA